MKVLLVFALLALCSGTATETSDKTGNPMGQVVTLLQEMLDQSVKDGEAERTTFGKFKCYCDSSRSDAEASIKAATNTIDLTSADIEELQGSTGVLSSQCADLKAAMETNQAEREEATAIRDDDRKTFQELRTDHRRAINQMNNAIRVLTAVGADQSVSTGADNTQFMRGFGSKASSLLSLQTEVQTALKAAAALMPAEHQSTVTAFLQAPFSATYTSQSAQVMGIIKNMRDTFTKNLEDATKTEEADEEAFNELIATKQADHDEMGRTRATKQETLGANDKTLAAREVQHAEATAQKESDEKFLSELNPMCAKKTASYENRKSMRAGEETALAEAISILNSDEAFESFGKANVGHSASFIQLRAVHRHVDGGVQGAQKMLQTAAQETKSARLSKVVAAMQAGNPFESVLKEIDSMINVILEERKADAENLDQCKKDRRTSHRQISKLSRQIDSSNNNIDGLNNDIDDLHHALESTQNTLEDLANHIKELTEDRNEEHATLTQEIHDSEVAQAILARAIKTLSAYYDELERKIAAGEASLLQKAAPDTWSGDYQGQSGAGAEVLKLLNDINDTCRRNEKEATRNDADSLEDFNRAMDEANTEVAHQEKSLANIQNELAQTEDSLEDTKRILKTRQTQSADVEQFLESIKLGCNFIVRTYQERRHNQSIETSALRRAAKLIQGTPAYINAENAAHVEGLGDCAEKCEGDEKHVNCKACLAKVTVPAYCAGHQRTRGCRNGH